MATVQETIDRINKINQNRQPVGKIEGVKRALGQGLSYGFGDEIEAQFRSRENNTSYEDEVRQARDKLQKFRKSNPFLAYGSEVVGSIPTSLGVGGLAVKGGIKGLGKIGALEGAAYGAGVGETDEDRIKQAVAGGAFGGSIAKIGQAILPKTTELAKKFLKRDIRLTAGQSVKDSGALGQLVSGIESSSTSIPGVGASISEAKTQAISDFNKFAMLEALESVLTKSQRKILEKKLRNNNGFDAYRIVDEHLSEVYTDAVKNLNFSNETLIKLDSDVLDIVTSANLRPDEEDLIMRIIQDVFADNVKLKNNKLLFTGQNFKDLESELFRQQVNYFGKKDFGSDKVALTIQSLRDLFKRVAADEAGGGLLQKANLAHAKLIPISQAVLSANRTKGIFSSSQFLNALKKSDYTKGKKVTTKGTNSQRQLAEEADELLGQFVPDSGTASRLIAGEGAISPKNLLRYVAPTILAQGFYGLGRAGTRGLLNLPSNITRAVRPSASGLLSGPLTTTGETLLNRGNQ
jgi:hypothetical protein